jgi:dienelactone hydrolase
MNELTRRAVLRAAAIGLAWRSAPGPARALFAQQADDDESLQRRRRYLEILQQLLGPTESAPFGRINAADRTWEQWQSRTQELPPDFETMPSLPFLPDPLNLVEDGRSSAITTVEQWGRQRAILRALFERWIFGTLPPPPDRVEAQVTSTAIEGDVTVERVKLTFGPAGAATLELELLVPPGDGPFPVFLTNHPRRRPWTHTAIRRGYIGCICFALDAYYGTPDDSNKWIEIYPEHDWSVVARWAWGAMRAVDYLVARRDVDRQRIAIGGHSRNSKSALLAAAFDERIGAVVPSRGNTGDQIPWRFTTDLYGSESIEELVEGLPHWFHPRLRFFVGREHKLPVDQNQLLAMVAPRGLLMSHAYMEHQGNPLGFERAYRSALEVYRLHGKEENLGLYQQPGEHPSSVEDVERYFDFFDAVFGRRSFPAPRIWIHGYDFDQWRERAGEAIDPGSFAERRPGDFLLDAGGAPIADVARLAARRAEIQKAIRWCLGDEPPGAPLPAQSKTRGFGLVETGWQGQLLERPTGVGGAISATRVDYGDDLQGELYFPTSVGAKAGGRVFLRLGAELPLVVWLHAYSYNMGYSRYAYWAPLVERGFAVMAFDQIGFGVRGGHGARFYERYPDWSLLGKMIVDTRAAIDAVLERRYADPARIYLVGYGLGAKVALWTAALDDRIAGLSAACGVTALRLDSPSRGTEGVRHYSHLHGLLPRLGYFVGSEPRLPVDYDEVLAAIAPRPVHVLAPELDRYNPIDDVRAVVEAARGAWVLHGKPDALVLETPFDFNRYANVWRRQAEWLGDLAGLPRPTQPEPTPAETTPREPAATDPP